MRSDTKNEIEVDVNTIRELQQALEKEGFETVVLNSEKEVKDFINQRVPDEQIVGLGDSITTCSLNIRNILFSKGSKIFYSWDGSNDYNRSLDTFDNHIRPAYYLSRVNAITTDGRILMKDFAKEAAEENAFPQQMFAFAGLNRLCEEFDVERDSIQKYPIIDSRPQIENFTVALLPFLNY